MRSGAKLVEQRVTWSGALHQGRIIDFERHSIVNHAHLLIAGEKNEGAASAVAQDAGDLGAGSTWKRGRAWIGKMLRHVKQRLFRVFEVAGDHQRPRVADTEAALGEFKRLTDGPRCGREDDGIQR